MTDVAASFHRLIQFHREIASRVPDYLRPPVGEDELARTERQLGLGLHSDVKTLYRIADGIDEQRWYDKPRVPPWMLPRAEFPSLAASRRHAETLRRQAEGDDDIWKPSWFPVLHRHADEVLVVDCADSRGEVWLVRWEADDIGPVAPDLATLLDHATERMRNSGVSTTDEGFTLVLPPDDPPEGWY